VKGTGEDIIMPFAKMLEFAAYAAQKDSRYEKFPELGDKGESNSNGMSMALFEHAGLLSMEVKAKIEKANEGWYNAEPGIDDNFHQKIWPEGRDSVFAQYDADPQALLNDPKAMAQMYEFVDTPHLGKQQADICEASSEKECVVPVGVFRPGPSGGP